MKASFVLVAVSLWTGSFFWGARASVTAVFVFGDSLADVGNNDFLPTVSAMKADFLPNGIDYPGGVPTGRFSNGFNIIDYLAIELGFKQSPPAYLSITNVEQMMQGVNFASGGSGLLNSTGTKVLTFATQIDKFKTVVDAITKKLGNKRATDLLFNSIYLISTGSNDMFGYYLTLGPQNATMNEQFVASLVGKYEDYLKLLFQYGARKFGLLGMSHLGCIPFTENLNPTGRCIEQLNGLARGFNEVAKGRLQELQPKLNGMKYSYANVYDVMSVALANPSLFGYKDVKNGCCGSGKFKGAASCTPNATYCADRNSYLFWDRFHPTQYASKVTAMEIYGGTRRFVTPINLKTLAALT